MKYELSDSEKQIMDFLWESENSVRNQHYLFRKVLIMI